MIRRNGAQRWENIHITQRADLDDLLDIDNSAPGGNDLRGFDLLKQTAQDLDQLIQQARQQRRRIRALGSAWALTDIAITDGWLVNTKMLNRMFEVTPQNFAATYPEAKRPYLILAQCGISIAELNTALEVPPAGGLRRALKTAGIGAGQTAAGAVSGNTHGSAVNFGATPEWVAGMQIVTGSGQSVWVERLSHPVLNDDCIAQMGAVPLRNDDVFNAAVVGFGAFGIITCLAIETDPIYQLSFPPVRDISHADLKQKLNHFNSNDPAGLYHYEFVWDPYSKAQVAMEAAAVRVPFEAGHPGPKPVWIVRNDQGFALAGKSPSLFLGLPFIPPGMKTRVQFKQYRQRAILGNVRATPGQLFTATITYLEGYTESAIGVSISDAAAMIEISTDVIKRLKIPAMSQVRAVHPSPALLSFTQLGPKTCVFEYGLVHDGKFVRFERELTAALTQAGVAYTLHWSKNSGINPERLEAMYGADKVARWKAARRTVFGGDTELMRVFDNDHLARAGLSAG